MFKKWLKNKRPTNKEMYQSKNREVRTLMKNAKNNFWEQTCLQIENL